MQYNLKIMAISKETRNKLLAVGGAISLCVGAYLALNRIFGSTKEIVQPTSTPGNISFGAGGAEQTPETAQLMVSTPQSNLQLPLSSGCVAVSSLDHQTFYSAIEVVQGTEKDLKSMDVVEIRTPNRQTVRLTIYDGLQNHVIVHSLSLVCPVQN
jgi:hypothetical protein